MNRCAITFIVLVAACAPATTPTQAPPPVVVTPIASPPSGSAVTPPRPSAPSRPAAAAPKTIAKAALPAPVPPAPERHAAPPLDLKSLEQRLKDTNAIGVLTKLSLKNQVDDLVARFKSYHAGQRPPTLPELRPAFELLLMKVLSLLQDHDTALANDINASREAIWGVLADPQKLAQFS